MEKPFKFGIDSLTTSIVMDLSEGRLSGIIDEQAKHHIETSCQHVDEIVRDQTVVYGINTGFGPLCDTLISPSETTQLQHNLLMSHSVGVGKLLSPHLSKTMLILKLHALCLGYSGIRLQTVERILWMIENDICPCVPEKGSVGASGDLAPLAHLFLPLIGLGEVFYKGAQITTDELLKKFGIQALRLHPKEGLALINGTQFIAAHAVVALHRFKNILDAADIIGAMTLDGMMGSVKPLDERLHAIRPFKGNQQVAQRLRNILQGSEINNAHLDCSRVQDPYSIRCMPQVHGASRTAYMHLLELTEIEINSVTDNPIILGSHDTISGGNFHGQPLAVPLDYASVAAAELGNISDRRSYLVIEGRYDLPKLLIEDAGLNSGFMIPQYSSAALVSENKGLCFPASADSIPTSLGQEDHVSMGSIGGRKLNQIIDNVEFILAIELLYAAQAIDFRRPLKSSLIIEACHNQVRNIVPFATADRVFADDINVLQKLISSRNLVMVSQQTAESAGITLDKS